jgi:hypothetical protein
VNRPNGVAHILAVSVSASTELVTLPEPEAADLKAGKLYLAVVNKTDPRLSARADLAPAADGGPANNNPPERRRCQPNGRSGLRPSTGKRRSVYQQDGIVRKRRRLRKRRTPAGP